MEERGKNFQSWLGVLKNLTYGRNLAMGAMVMGLFFLLLNFQGRDFRPSSYHSTIRKGTQPLVMEGGDPYIRALMRTITASEANVTKPYNVIYGGKYVSNLSRHPSRCVPIIRGPNIGNCTTAAGRYQFLNTTWSEKAEQYHPKPEGFWRWQYYSFEPQYQDRVVHDWLSDAGAWGADIPALLRQSKIEKVLRLLSGTWTSLGYGIETNSMSRHLPIIYRQILKEELE